MRRPDLTDRLAQYRLAPREPDRQTPAEKCCSINMAPGIIEVTVQADHQCLVDAVHGPSPPLKIGDVLRFDTAAPIGDKALLRADNSRGASYAQISAYPSTASVADCQGASTDVATLASALSQDSYNACGRTLTNSGPQ